MKHISALALFFLLTLPLFASGSFESLMSVQPADQWTENGQVLSGWVKYGGDATFEVEEVEYPINDKDVKKVLEIVGTRGPGHNTFLCTEKKYSNFIFKCEFKFDILCNSGVQFRSEVRENGDHTSVYGYQYEMSAPSNTGCIYDENRRDRWLEPISPAQIEKTQRLLKTEDWNEIVIQCVGPSVKTWLNGEKISDLLDIAPTADNIDQGFFGLQVHSGETGKVRWRNIEIQELPETPWMLLYCDGQFGDVEIKPVGSWEVQEDGSVIGTTESGQPKDGMVLSNQDYTDFVVKVSFKKMAGNSGLYFRATEVDKNYWLKGYQNEIEAGQVCGGLWEVEGRGWVARNDEIAAKVYRAEDWNDIGTVAVGDRILTFLNGQKIVDIDDPYCAKEGKTGLQLHGGGDQGYHFREYWIMPLDRDAVDRIREYRVPFLKKNSGS